MVSKVKGFTLVEVLVAVLLLSIGLLGLASLQTWGLRMTGNAMHRSQAALFANDMAERIRANPAGTDGGFYHQASAACPDTVTGCNSRVQVCSSQGLANADYLAVMCGGGTGDGAGIDDLLPSGRLVINCSSTGSVCSVEVFWLEVADRFTQDPNLAAAQRSVRVSFMP